MEQFRKFDSNLNKLLLDEKYAFAFTKSDGFTHRLLNAELTIDWNYKYVLELDSFECSQKNQPPYREDGSLPKEIHEYFNDLIESDYLSLKDNYDYITLDITDIGSQQYLLNLDKTTKNINILNGLPLEYFDTATEKLLYNFNEYLKNWIEEKYKAWISR